MSGEGGDHALRRGDGHVLRRGGDHAFRRGDGRVLRRGLIML